MTDPEALDLALWLSRLKVNSIHLECNADHPANYKTAAQWIDTADADDELRECDPEELQEMKDTNTIWSLQIYKDTPIGSYRWCAPTMLRVIAKAKRAWREIENP